MLKGLIIACIMGAGEPTCASIATLTVIGGGDTIQAFASAEACVSTGRTRVRANWRALTARVHRAIGRPVPVRFFIKCVPYRGIGEPKSKKSALDSL